MIKKISTLITIFITVIIQMNVFTHFFSAGTVPELVLILIIIWTVNEGFERKFWWIVLAGLFLDIFSFFPIGFNILSLVLISGVTGSLAKRFLVSPRGWKIIFILGAIILGVLINHLVINILFSGMSAINDNTLDRLILKVNDAKIFITCLYSALAFFLIYWPLLKIEEFLSIYDHNLSSQARFYKR